MIAYLPLFLQGMCSCASDGLALTHICLQSSWSVVTNVKAVIRLAKHFGSLSPAFKVFSTQISSHSIITNLTFGGARYLATTCISFAILDSRFAGWSIYLGMCTLIMLLYVTLTI